MGEVENFVYRRCRRLESHKIIGKRLRASARDTRREKKENAREVEREKERGEKESIIERGEVNFC